MIKNLDDIKKKFGKKIITNVSLAKYSWFNLGGPAELLFKPENIIDIQEFFKITHKNLYPLTIMGAGSNTLIRDAGVGGITIKLSPKFSYVNKLSENKIEVGAATLDKTVSNFASDNGLSGFEFLSCIPGTIGGAIRMNSGCYNQEISQILKKVNIINLKGELKEIKKEDIKFFYRGCSLNENFLILSAEFEGIIKSIDLVKKKQEEFINRKKLSQPNQIKTCGSTFKNPNGHYAWKLIKDCGCTDITVGGAKISPKHNNFFLNDGNATSSDIEKLIDEVKKKVLEKKGINLELEIKIIGKKNN